MQCGPYTENSFDYTHSERGYTHHMRMTKVHHTKNVDHMCHLILAHLINYLDCVLVQSYNLFCNSGVCCFAPS